ncbi:hypothetical protein [Streptacidiphilus sp. PAMC 29251]
MTTTSASNGGLRVVRAEALAAVRGIRVRDFPSTSASTLIAATARAEVALSALEAADDLRRLPPSWWVDFDQDVRSSSAWRTPAPVPAAATTTGQSRPLSEAWQWALAVCAADGRRREAALLENRLPLGHPVLMPLLVLRCADWAVPVGRRAERRLASALAAAAPVDLAVACAVAWACEPRSRGAAAVRMATDQLHAADPAVWQHLFALSDHRTRRRALTEALRQHALGSSELIALALADPDVTVAHGAAESVLRQSVPLVDAALSSAAEAVVNRILAARIPRVRAAAVTVLRRGQRPDLAVPLLLDRPALVRETARWVLRSHGQDPAAHCREQIARPGAVTTAGAVSGLAECGDAADVPGCAPNWPTPDRRPAPPRYAPWPAWPC